MSDSYQHAARWYDTVIEPLNRRLKAIALRVAPPRPGARVLDVGCGTGTMLALYARHDCQLWGLDASPAMLDVARARLGGDADLRAGDAAALPYEDGFFDWVVFTLMLHELHPAVRARALAEAARVIGERGQVLVVDYAARGHRRLRGFLTTGLITAIERLAGGAHWQGYCHFVSHGGAAAMASAAGLELETERLLGHGNLAVTVLRRPSEVESAAGRAEPTAVYRGTEENVDD